MSNRAKLLRGSKNRFHSKSVLKSLKKYSPPASLETQRSQRNILFSFAADPRGIGSAFHRAEEGGK
jgi:hypothetical protein